MLKNQPLDIAVDPRSFPGGVQIRVEDPVANVDVLVLSIPYEQWGRFLVGTSVEVQGVLFQGTIPQVCETCNGSGLYTYDDGNEGPCYECRGSEKQQGAFEAVG